MEEEGQGCLNNSSSTGASHNNSIKGSSSSHGVGVATERSSLLSHHAHRRSYFPSSHRWKEQYHEFIKLNREDDAVSIAVKHFLVCLLVTVLLWLVSYVLVMLQIIDHDHFSNRNWPLFLPFWLSSLFGIFCTIQISCQVCRNSNLINREERLYLRATGREAELNFVDYESLPLMRRLLFWCMVSGISLSLVLIAQLLYYFWFIGLLAMWHALVPIAVLLGLYTVYMYLVNIFSLTSCGIVTLLFVEVAIFGWKESHPFSWLPWHYGIVPLVIALLLTLYRLLMVQYRHMKGYYELSCQQHFALNAYFIAVLGMFLGMGLLLLRETYQRNVFLRYSYILWTISIPTFVSTFAFIAVVEGIEIAETRGFKQAKRLSRSPDGWEFTATGNKESIWLLGEVLIHPKNMSDILSKYSSGTPEDLSSLKMASSSAKSYQQEQDIETALMMENVNTDIFPAAGRLSEIELPEFLK